MRIAAFDLSLSATGLARHGDDPNDPVHVDRIRPKNGAADPYARLVEIRDDVVYEATVVNADVVVIEGYAFGRPNAAHKSGELGGVVKVALFESGLPIAVLPPSSLKKYATGKGGASKDEVLIAAVHRSGMEFADNNEADAWWLWQMACCHYGLEHVQMPEKNREALEAVEWPTLTKGATHEE